MASTNRHSNIGSNHFTHAFRFDIAIPAVCLPGDCREAPYGYPMTGEAAPCFSAWEGDMLPQVCIMPGSTDGADTAPGTDTGGPAEQETTADGCTYKAPLLGKFLPGCVNGCKAHSVLEEALAACSKQPTCGGVTQSADQGQLG